ncbi:DNA polymerase III subunit chi [Algihabitans sp.]|uniref:DNA polymerase III subunit chi n=1 Tax=Algihabitans sp. TaxID=2821514 RepID=UPI003BAB013C
MTEVRFYHLTRRPLLQALPRLLDLTVQRGKRALVRSGDPEKVEPLAEHLWTYDEKGFLPHGTSADGQADKQPIWITAAEENPNASDYLFLIHGADWSDVASFERCMLLFDGHDDVAVQAARGQWKVFREGGHSLSYWQQDDEGRWADKASQT